MSTKLIPKYQTPFGSLNTGEQVDSLANMPDYAKPITNYTPPKSDAPETIAWLANWLNNRRSQLYNNLGGFFDNRKASVLHNTGLDENYPIRFTYNILLGKWAEWNTPSKRNYVNKNFYSLIENAASAPLRKRKLESKDSTRLGLYVHLPYHYVEVQPYISEGNTFGDSVMVHEYTHAMNAKPQEAAIKDILDTSKIDENYFNGLKNPKRWRDYWLKPTEIYSRMMEVRKRGNLKPSQVVDLSFLNLNRTLLRDARLDMFSDEDLMRLFNEVAYLPKKESNDVYMAKHGTSLKPKYIQRPDLENYLLLEFEGIYYPTHVIQDKSFNSGYGDIETMLGEDAYYPATGYKYKNPWQSENTIVFNNNIKNPKSAVGLDYLHVLRKEDTDYLKLLELLHEAAKDSDLAYTAKHRYDEDKERNKGEEVMPYERYLLNEEDGWLRNIFYKGTKEQMKEDNYYPDKELLMKWNPQLVPITKQIYNYLHPIKLPEIVVTAKKNK